MACKRSGVRIPIAPPQVRGTVELHADDELAAHVDEAEPTGEDAAPPARDAVPLDLEAALEAAGRARAILAERGPQASRDAEADSDDLVRRREVEAPREAQARRDARRQ